MPDEIKRDPLLADTELADLEQVQNRLVTSLIKMARDNPTIVKPQDWVQGGWTRAAVNRTSPDRVTVGWREGGAPQEMGS